MNKNFGFIFWFTSSHCLVCSSSYHCLSFIFKNFCTFKYLGTSLTIFIILCLNLYDFSGSFCNGKWIKSTFKFFKRGEVVLCSIVAFAFLKLTKFLLSFWFEISKTNHKLKYLLGKFCVMGYAGLILCFVKQPWLSQIYSVNQFDILTHSINRFILIGASITLTISSCLFAVSFGNMLLEPALTVSLGNWLCAINILALNSNTFVDIFIFFLKFSKEQSFNCKNCSELIPEVIQHISKVFKFKNNFTLYADDPHPLLLYA